MQIMTPIVTAELPTSVSNLQKKETRLVYMSTPTTKPMQDLRKSSSVTISRKTAAEYLGVDPRTVTAGIAAGNIPAIKLGRRVVIPREKFLALFEVPND